MSADYPFAAVVGLDAVKRALLCILVNPRLSSILLIGARGTGKSILLRSLEELSERKAHVLPLNATEDRIFGGIDFEKTLKQGQRACFAGILEEANEEILLADDFNLFREEVRSALLQVLATGQNLLERDGLSACKDTQFQLVAAMTPEEGELSRAVLDRFALAVGFPPNMRLEDRTEIVQRRMAFEELEKDFFARYAREMEEMRARVKKAQALVSSVELSNAMLRLIAEKCALAHSAGHRAEIYLAEAARSLAALAGRNYVMPEDVEEAALYTLWHRAQEENLQPREEATQEQENDLEENQDQQEEEGQENQEQPEDNTPPPPQEEEQTEDGEQDGEQEAEQQEDTSEAVNEKDDVAAIGEMPPLRILMPQEGRGKITRGEGKRNRTRSERKEGRYVRAATNAGDGTDIAIDATLRAAAPAQQFRGRTGKALVLRPEDFRQKMREKRIGTTFVFVVDASGSMGARKRMSAVKGAILSILFDAYQKRDRVALVAFRRQSAELLLPVTRSIELAERSLATLPTGGRTPLSAGLCMGGEVLEKILKQDAGADPVLILVTDGRANQVTEGDAVEEALNAAEKVSDLGVRALVLDTENGWQKFGIAKKIAERLGGNYQRLDEISADNIVRLVRSLR